MSESAAIAVWLGLLAYLAIGALAWLWILACGLRRLDPSTDLAPWRVKALLSPGFIVLWPLIARRILARASEDRS